MNVSSIFGLLASLTVFVVSIITSTDAKEVFLNKHAILIVVGGTAAATLLCFPISNIITLVKVFFAKILGKFSHAHDLVIDELVDLAKGYREDPNYLQSKAEGIKTHFLKEAVELMVLSGLNAKDLDEVLQKRALTHFKRYEEEASTFKTISKFPPAFGLMGTTLGMISLLQNMGSPDSFKSLGPSMAIGLVATFYGIALSNLVFIPVAENLSKLNKEDEILREIVIDGIKLVRLKTHPIAVMEHLKSYLLPKEREKLKKVA